MPGDVKRRSAKTGLPPGSLIHIGEQHSATTRITLCVYDDTGFQEREVETLEGVAVPAGEAVTWIHIDGLHEVRHLEQLGKAFGLHPLTLEDILNTEQRPKSEDHGEYHYIVLKVFHQDAGGALIPEQVSIVFGRTWLVSLREREGRLFEPIRERLRVEKGRLRKGGTDHLAHALIDVIVDSYFTVLDRIGERIEGLETALIGRPSPTTLRSIQTLKREMLLLRKSAWPLRELLGNLDRSESPLIHGQSALYFRDITDHAVQVIDTIETYREMLSGMLDIYLSSLSNRLNEVMKVLTVIATLFMPLTFLAGVYGMNFRYMPELEWRWGYFALWGVMLAVACGMLIVFRRKKWL